MADSHVESVFLLKRDLPLSFDIAQLNLEQDLRPKGLAVVMTSRTTGYVTIRRNGSVSDTRYLQVTFTVPRRHTLVYSFKQFTPDVVVYIKEVRRHWSSSSEKGNFANMYYLRRGKVKVYAGRDACMNEENTTCFQLSFSFFPKSRAPVKLSGGFLNCSVEHYSSFEPHLTCNLKTECEDGRDETEHCLFSSADCKGLVALCDRCYKFLWELYGVKREGDPCWTKAGGILNFPTCLYDPYCTIVSKSKRFWYMHKLKTGLLLNDLSLQNMYRHSVHSKRTVFYHTFHRDKYLLLSEDDGQITYLELDLAGMLVREWEKGKHTPLCEVIANKTEENSHDRQGILLPITHFPLAEDQHYITVCRDGLATYTLLLCGSKKYNKCDRERTSLCYYSREKSQTNVTNILDSTSPVSLSSTFTCSDAVTTMSYSLVCDFLSDCPDSSDESFCSQPLCRRTFTCTDGRCVPYNRVCDQIAHCYDQSDEEHCDTFKALAPNIGERFPSPALINFDGIRRFIVIQMDSNQSCPNSHYRCVGEYNDCLPVYTRCNGMYDCFDHQDEQGCVEMTCPGFYQCRFSKTCLHSDHMCDGWPQCPQYDDELWCRVTCPVDCLCQVHSFLCLSSFRAELFPHIRSLDATGSGMTLTDVKSNVYLIHLVLANCGLMGLPETGLMNLKTLDLSSNQLQQLNMTRFLRLKNLQSLTLAKNPVTTVCQAASAVSQKSVLTLIDMSHTKLTAFDFKVMEHFSRLQKLYLSFTNVHTLTGSGFQFTPLLTELYMDGTPVTLFQPDMFKDLFYLRFISTKNYKLCCMEILPHNFDTSHCYAPKDEISSCEDLLQSWTYRGFLWLMACLALSGNVFCFSARLFVRSMASSSGFSVFVTNLTMADLLMGVYMTVIGVADERLRGRYLHHDDAWKSSTTCKVAGFLSLLSSEVSALIICLITLDRFIVLCFPFSTLKFDRTSAWMACLLIWLVGWFLALLPLLPVTSHWEFYSQTGICIPLPVTRKEFKGKLYSISVLIVLNFVLFLLISVGQAFVYWSVQKNALKMSSTQMSQDITIARRLITIALTDFLCWFPIGLCGLLALAGVPVSGEVNVALAIFVLPLNSAINPYMYTFNTLVEKRRKIKELKFLKWMESHAGLIQSTL